MHCDPKPTLNEGFVWASRYSSLPQGWAWFEERGITRIELVTVSANGESNAFWERLGCAIFAERRVLGGA